MRENLSHRIREAVDLVSQADGLLITAGAGMGVDSGLPDFRSPEGFWREYPALKKTRHSFTDVASPRAFENNPALAWGFYGHRLELYRRTVPHRGFNALLGWARHKKHGAFVFTSNVDGQFQQAGFSDESIIECHGSIHWLQCSKPCREVVWTANDLVPHVSLSDGNWTGEVPRCPHCGRVARPNILMFNDDRWLTLRANVQSAHLQTWLARAENVVVVEIGAGTRVSTVRSFSDSVSRMTQGSLIRINSREAHSDGRPALEIPAGALEVLSEMSVLIDSSWRGSGWNYQSKFSDY